MRLSVTLLVAPFLLISLACQQTPTEPSGADSSSLKASAWDEKVTGGGELDWSSLFTITVSATDDVDKGAFGQVTYYLPAMNRDWHGTVECIWTDAPSEAIVVGPISPNGDSAAPAGEWFILEVFEGGEGSGDGVRFRVDNETAAMAFCQAGDATSPGATVIDGNFTVRNK